MARWTGRHQTRQQSPHTRRPPRRRGAVGSERKGTVRMYSGAPAGARRAARLLLCLLRLLVKLRAVREESNSVRRQWNGGPSQPPPSCLRSLTWNGLFFGAFMLRASGFDALSCDRGNPPPGSMLRLLSRYCLTSSIPRGQSRSTSAAPLQQGLCGGKDGCKFVPARGAQNAPLRSPLSQYGGRAAEHAAGAAPHPACWALCVPADSVPRLCCWCVGRLRGCDCASLRRARA